MFALWSFVDDKGGKNWELFFVMNKASFLQGNGIVCVCGKHKEYASFIAVRCPPGLCLVEFAWVPVKCI